MPEPHSVANFIDNAVPLFPPIVVNQAFLIDSMKGAFLF